MIKQVSSSQVFLETQASFTEGQGGAWSFSDRRVRGVTGIGAASFAMFLCFGMPAISAGRFVQPDAIALGFCGIFALAALAYGAATSRIQLVSPGLIECRRFFPRRVLRVRAEDCISLCVELCQTTNHVESQKLGLTMCFKDGGKEHEVVLMATEHEKCFRDIYRLAKLLAQSGFPKASVIVGIEYMVDDA
ncbi:MAG: hypothetical protein KDB07_02195 [Planctomycetes bacterium]|nr:hypothetical protein [Planctomycetota bacterium]